MKQVNIAQKRIVVVCAVLSLVSLAAPQPAPACEQLVGAPSSFPWQVRAASRPWWGISSRMLSVPGLKLDRKHHEREAFVEQNIFY